jgi:deoxyribodipyrimidine photolyase-related protein
MGKLRVILCDQLSHTITSLKSIDAKHDVIFMAEVMEDFKNANHHKKKICFIISAMRHFAQELIHNGYNVVYIRLDDSNNSGSLVTEILKQAEIVKPQNVVVTWPGEYRILQNLKSLQTSTHVPLEIKEDDRFLSSPEEFTNWAKDRKELRMEFFYRLMRQKYHVLMNYAQPEGGKWNLDSENRKFPKEKLNVPNPYISLPDEMTKDVIRMVGSIFSNHFGDLEPFHFAVTRQQALEVLNKFIAERLMYFGDYQDAMVQNEPWMYHSHISFYLNVGLLKPLECIKLVEDQYYIGKISLNAAEGFIRQILGWREYVRGIYWMAMPTYKDLNYFEAKRPLPAFYWTGKTQMNCISQCVKETKENAYAHHIQRLMVLGNFALLAGLDPDHMNNWYLSVYADAFEWVELPNVTGMILFADGGYLASKPYAASGAYINKMSNYCQSCVYKVDKKNGPDACPFNYLYWDFLDRHRSKLKGNHRLTMMYASLDRMGHDKTRQVQQDSKRFFDELDSTPYE